MTTYAYDPSTTHLLAVWGCGAGSIASTVARLHARTPDALGCELARGLTQLSSTAWLSYLDAELVGPVAAVDSLHAIQHPNLPRAGRRKVDDRWLVESAHDVGRTLVDLGSAGVRRAVVDEPATARRRLPVGGQVQHAAGDDDLGTEFEAVERALRGDLAGRARQAVELTRLDASPLQIMAADRLLHELPMVGPKLFTEVEPTAACVAAAHWLRAAVDVTLAVSGRADCAEVLVVEEAAEPFDVVAPRIVLARMEEGSSPLAVVQRLVKGALQAARGFVPSPQECDLPGYILLDPARPSRHLLDRLTMALRTCARVHYECLDPALVSGTGAARVEAAGRVFDAQVRAEAARTAERLSSTERVRCP